MSARKNVAEWLTLRQYTKLFKSIMEKEESYSHETQKKKQVACGTALSRYGADDAPGYCFC